MEKSKKPILVAVYGSLRKGLHNHDVLGTSTLVGEFDTEPIYDMFSCGGSYPGLRLNGSTSIKVEVYEVSEAIDKRVERLEGYTKGSEDTNHYNKIMINTPFGEAGIYIYNYATGRMPKVESGDWKIWRADIQKQVKIY